MFSVKRFVNQKAAEKREKRVLAEIEVDDDSEEEVTTTVGEKDLSVSGR